jgi:hypothetical protein
MAQKNKNKKIFKFCKFLKFIYELISVKAFTVRRKYVAG